MRAALIASVAVIGLVGLPAAGQAAPVAVHGIVISKSDIVQVAGGCGPGWHSQGWRDRWGHWRRRCVPNRYY